MGIEFANFIQSKSAKFEPEATPCEADLGFMVGYFEYC
jgi:hypothetical protein